jgi:hypothetical protein
MGVMAASGGDVNRLELRGVVELRGDETEAAVAVAAAMGGVAGRRVNDARGEEEDGLPLGAEPESEEAEGGVGAEAAAARAMSRRNGLEHASKM